MQHSPFPVRSELHGAWNLAALVVAVLAGHHQINGHQNAAQALLQPHGLAVTAGQLRLFHEQVEIVRRSQIALNCRAKRDQPQR
jgi:hypothetical protein